MTRPDPIRASLRHAVLAVLAVTLALAGSAAFALGQDPSPAPTAAVDASPGASDIAPGASPAAACAPLPPVASPVPGASASTEPVSGASPVPVASLAPGDSPATTDGPIPELSPTPADTSAPETGNGNAHGDVPDNAVFLTYHDASHGFSIQYVEGWQVTPGVDGVVIRDKDSSETIAMVPLPADIAGCVTDGELPGLRALKHFSLIGRDLVKVNGRKLIHLTFHLPAAPDPVTGKRVPSTVDRYYVPGPTGMAIVSLSTPDGVDNVDAFRQMILSFMWS